MKARSDSKDGPQVGYNEPAWDPLSQNHFFSEFSAKEKFDAKFCSSETLGSF